MSELDLPGDNIVALPFVAARRAASAPASSRCGRPVWRVTGDAGRLSPHRQGRSDGGHGIHNRRVGSGKEVVADTIHQRSERASFPFLAVNCGAIPAI
jgi:hypothetical protein